jgi:ABC-type transporter Mla maintaining outer membrane lipid asymmetry ATPase subunit MlaF
MATPDESAASLFQRTDTQPFHTGIPFLDRFGVRPGQGLEVMGASGAGKTELLIQVHRHE